jgi:hypothetical protein
MSSVVRWRQARWLLTSVAERRSWVERSFIGGTYFVESL